MKNSKNIMIVALLISVVALAIGYAAFATTLTINGNATVNSNWQVEIISITPSYSAGASEATHTPAYPTFTTTTASFDTVLTEPGDYATYTVVVKNKGSITAKFNGITPADFTTLNSTAPSVINYSVTTKPAANATLAPNAEATFVFRVEYDPNTTNEQYAALTSPITKALTATIEYVQNTTSGS